MKQLELSPQAKLTIDELIKLIPCSGTETIKYSFDGIVLQTNVSKDITDEDMATVQRLMDVCARAIRLIKERDTTSDKKDFNDIVEYVYSLLDTKTSGNSMEGAYIANAKKITVPGYHTFTAEGKRLVEEIFDIIPCVPVNNFDIDSTGELQYKAEGIEIYTRVPLNDYSDYSFIVNWLARYAAAIKKIEKSKNYKLYKQLEDKINTVRAFSMWIFDKDIREKFNEVNSKAAYYNAVLYNAIDDDFGCLDFDKETKHE